MKRTVALLRARDGDYCGRCSGLIEFAAGGMGLWGPTIGHVVPASKGGSDAVWNLRLEHRRCNMQAGDRMTPPAARLATPVVIE